MALSAQDKILYVANKLGLSTLNLMQGSTGAVYDADTDFSGQFFSSASRHQNPSITNVTENQFEVNEALLVENVSFYLQNPSTKATFNLQNILGSDVVIVFDLIIGNKRTMKDTPVFAAGAPYTFANVATNLTVVGEGQEPTLSPRHQVFMEGAGILIPPQVQWYVDYRVFNVVTGAVVDLSAIGALGCSLFGTRVLLNFNTSI
jgi:hypothetical protein